MLEHVAVLLHHALREQFAAHPGGEVGQGQPLNLFVGCAQSHDQVQHHFIGQAGRLGQLRQEILAV